MPHGQRRLFDGIIGSEIRSEAVEMLKRKGAKCRMISNASLKRLNKKSLDKGKRFRYVRGGFLIQPNYTFILNLRDEDLIKTRQLSKQQESNLLLAWAIGSTSNSNTITLVKNSQLIGNGVGQQSRVYGCKLAIQRSKDTGHDAKNAVAYSDSFFPFEDGIEVLKEAGISAVLATSGSVNDGKIISYCKKNKINLYLIPDKKARGFFGH
jgi:AICAR transformylase/IMP cyclohydrolase PurH